MHDALALLADLDSSDVEWILNAAVERHVSAGTPVIREGDSPEDLWFLLEGLVEVDVAELGDVKLAHLGPGEILGEMSLLERRGASATVRAAEDSLLLALPLESLEQRLAADPPFAARLYRSFGRVLARRLRERVASLGRMLRDRRDTPVSGLPHPIAKALSEFKALVHEADHTALANQGIVPEAIRARVREQFAQLSAVLSDSGRQSAPHSTGARRIATALQREMLPLLLLARAAERAYSKPRGYAGDYLMIEWIYREEVGGTGRVGPLIDRCFMDIPAAQAVRNRRGLLASEIRDLFRTANEPSRRVTSLACGPAQELFDVYQTLDEPSRLESWLIDIDPQALDFVRQRRDDVGLGSCMHLEQGNLIYLATGRESLELPPQDLVYSIGLTDYFDDKFVINLLNYVYDLLKPGARVILGNFHPNNPSRTMLEWLVEWSLIHRTEEDMNRIFLASRFKRACSRILFEPEGINLFAEGVKPGSPER